MKPDQNFNPDANPFESILASLKEQPQGQPQGGPTQGGPTPQQMQQGGMMGKPIKTPPDQTAYGETSGGTPFLTQAIKAMENFLKESTDTEEIAMGRSIVGMLSRLIANDQEKQMGQLQK